MIIKKNLSKINNKIKINLAIGTFDAMHKGHLKIISLLFKASQDKKIKSCIITFQNRPKHFLQQNNDGIILSNNDRIDFFKSLNIDYLYYLNFTKKFAQMKAIDFIEKITSIMKCKPSRVIESPNQFENTPLFLIFRKLMIPKITTKDKITAEFTTPNGLRDERSIDIPPLKDISNHLNT